MRIIIAEDAAVLRVGLEHLLADAGHDIVASVPDAKQLLDAVERLNTPETCAAGTAAQLALIDVRMPPSYSDEGIRAAVLLRATHPELRTLIFSQYVEERYATELLSSGHGGFGYLLKDRVSNIQDFLNAVHRVGSGETVLDPEVVSQLFVRSKARAALDRLTPRETDVLRAMAEGLTNAAIGKALFITPGVVEKHVTSLFQKLGLHPQENEHRRVLAVLHYLELQAHHPQQFPQR